jgi:hypothetical protein
MAFIKDSGIRLKLAAFIPAAEAYTELPDALAGAEDEWLGLEILREALERQ